MISSDPAPSSSRTSARLIKIAVRTAVVIVVLGGGWAAWHYFGGRPATPAQTGAQTGGSRFSHGSSSGPVSVRDAVATRGDMPITLNALGTVTPLATVTVRSQISGQLQTVKFNEGQMVAAGEELASIDSRPYQATLEQEEAQLAKDKALLAQAQSDLIRYQSLKKQDSIASQTADDQAFVVEQDKAAIASDEAQIKATQLNIAYCHVTAPVAGLVGLRQVDAGNYVTPSDSNGLVVVTEMQPISVLFSVPEDNIAKVVAAAKSGRALTVTLYDRANVNRIADGQLSTYNNQVDTTTGTLKLRATFDNRDETLFPNQFVNVVLLVDTLKDVILVPSQAIQLGTSGNFVYVLDEDGTVKVTPVKTGPTDGTSTVVTEGLTAGQHVAIDGTDLLRDGAKANVVTASQATPSPAGTAPARPADNAADSQNGSRPHRRHPQADGAQGTAPPAAGASEGKATP